MRKIISLLIGIACIVIGIIILVSHFNAQKTQTAVTTATIVRIDSELQTDSDGFDTRYYYPVIEYTINGEKNEARLPNSGTTDSTHYKVGENVEIQYNPDNPSEMSEKGNKGGLFGGIFFIVCGFIVAIVAFIGRF